MKITLLKKNDVDSLISIGATVDSKLVRKVVELDLHNSLELEQINEIAILRERVLSDFNRDLTVQSHPCDKGKYSFVCLEDGDFIYHLGSISREYLEGEITGSSKHVVESVYISSDGEVQRTIELIPKLLKDDGTCDLHSQEYILYEYYNLSLFRGHPNVVQSLKVYLKQVDSETQSVVQLQRAYDGELIRLFYNIFTMLDDGTGLNFIKQFTSVFFGFTRGLCAVHKKGVHGDITPTNVLFYKDKSGFYTGVISDFETFQFGERQRRLFDHMLKELIAPESEEYCTKSSDIYALGYTLLIVRDRFLHSVIAASGKTGDEFDQFIEKMKNDIFGMLGVNELIDKALDKDYKKRPTAEEIHSHFKELMVKLNIPFSDI